MHDDLLRLQFNLQRRSHGLTGMTEELQLAGLKVHALRPDAANARGPLSVVVLLHGFAVPGTDLISATNELAVPPNTWLLFPEGPFDLGAAWGENLLGTRGWWETSAGRLHLARLTGQVRLAEQYANEGIESVRPVMAALLGEIQSNFDVTSERIVIGGFSQGAIASLDTVLHYNRKLAGLIFMSGTSVEPDALERMALRKGQMRALLSHGRLDPILPYVAAESLCAQLTAAQWDVTWVPFDGTHSIPEEVLRAASSALFRWLS